MAALLAGKITLAAVAGYVIVEYRREINQLVLYGIDTVVNAVFCESIARRDDVRASKMIYAIKKFMENRVNNTNRKYIRDGNDKVTYEISNGTYLIWFNYLPIWLTVTDVHFNIWTLCIFQDNLNQFINCTYQIFNMSEKNIRFYESVIGENKNYEWSFPNYCTPSNSNMTIGMKDVLKCVTNFKNNIEENKPHRLGILITGISGSGKSTMVPLIATKFNMDIYQITLNSSYMTDATLISLINNVPPNSLIAVDEFSEQYLAMQNNNTVKVSNAGILSAIDGCQKLSNGSIIILTAVSIKPLPADFTSQLLRPGRIDYQFKFDELLQ